jgi:hypothetical protein
MTLITLPRPDVRLELRLEDDPRMEEELAEFGRSVGPRIGAKRRTQAEKDDFCMRRLLIAMHAAGLLPLPVVVRAPTEGGPDFTLNWADGSRLGVEVTEAGEENWQAWRTATQGGTRLLPSNDGYAGDVPEQMVVRDVLRALNKKVGRAAGKPYASQSPCDLLIYENSEGGIMADRDKVVRSLAGMSADAARARPVFRQVHLILGSHVYLDVFGNERRCVDVSERYADDWAGWIAAQARHLRRREVGEIDFENLAEELDALSRKDRLALSSQLRRILVHLIKWRHRPSKRSESWRRSIDQGRSAMEELIEESPSLARVAGERLAKVYEKARREAARQTKLPLETIPETCLWSVDQVLDHDYLPEREP